MDNTGKRNLDQDMEGYSINGPINLKRKLEIDDKSSVKPEVVSTSLPLNLSPNPSQSSERKKMPPQRIDCSNQNFNSEPLVKSEPRGSVSPPPPPPWTGLCRAPYFFSSFQFPFIYPMPDGSSSAPSSSTGQEPKVSNLDQRSSPRTSPLKSKEEYDTRFESSRYEPLVSPPERLDINPQSQYQVKWSNHASRLSSFVSSLEGDVVSSDTILSLKDGTTFYAHRLVLACASPFFTRTLKNIPRDQHAVVVIPRASSRIMTILLNFCYTGIAEFPNEDLQEVFELAEDLEITGLLNEKEKKIMRPPSCPTSSPSSVFTSNHQPSSFVPENSFEGSSTSGNHFLFRPKPGSPGFSPAVWKRENIFNYTQPLKRIKSDSETLRSATRKPLKSSHSEPSRLLPKSESPQLPTTLLPFSCYSTPSSPVVKHVPESPTDDLSSPGIVIPRHVASGSRVLLWRFLLQLLHDHRYSPYYIRWLDRSQGIFRIMESDKVAQLWGLARKNKNMTYEKMSRGMRTYYKRSILYHLDGTKLIYRFNTLEPEIQHQMKYYELISRGMDDDDSKAFSFFLNRPSSSEKNSSTLSDQNNSPRQSVDMTPASNIQSPNFQISPHFLSDLPSNVYSLGSLLPPPHTNNS